MKDSERELFIDYKNLIKKLILLALIIYLIFFIRTKV